MNDEVTAYLETITPEYARSLLQNQVHSRHIRNDRVARYAEDMRNGKWLINGDTISIFSTGEVYDGVHRLYACIQANTEFKTIVVRGLDPDINVVTDYYGGPPDEPK